MKPHREKLVVSTGVGNHQMMACQVGSRSGFAPQCVLCGMSGSVAQRRAGGRRIELLAPSTDSPLPPSLRPTLSPPSLMGPSPPSLPAVFAMDRAAFNRFFRFPWHDGLWSPGRHRRTGRSP
eukprot:scaffold181237_cov26-Tisochrysis_lutea.AAC.4